MNKVYLCGPMRGIPDHNFPAFNSAAKALREAGYDVFNPAEHEPEGVDAFAPNATREYMKVDLPQVLEATMVVVLPGWTESKGASLEVHVAEACGIPVKRYDEIIKLT